MPYNVLAGCHGDVDGEEIAEACHKQEAKEIDGRQGSISRGLAMVTYVLKYIYELRAFSIAPNGK